jgi:putative SOS response-associated peptidase YedK
MNEMELTGKVILQKFAEGSKSDHDAVYLDTGKQKYRLKRRGGNPFYDASLHELVGKTIKARGNITPYFFEITNTPEEIT